LAVPLAEAAPQAPVEPVEGEGQPKKNDPKQKQANAVSHLLAQRLALLYATGQKDKATAIADLASAEHDPVARLGWAEGMARKGEYGEARKIATAGDNYSHRFEASLGVAVVAGSDKKTSEAKANAEDAWKAFEKLKASPKTKFPVWLMVELVRTCIRNDMAKEAKEVIDAMPETERGARGMAQLELLQFQLEAKSNQAVAPTLVDEVGVLKDTAAYAIAHQRVARHNTRLGKRSEALAALDSVDENRKPFVYLGVALGMLDARK
jgi:predicted negative regulator of RcsB-dependent stress response